MPKYHYEGALVDLTPSVATIVGAKEIPGEEYQVDTPPAPPAAQPPAAPAGPPMSGYETGAPEAPGEPALNPNNPPDTAGMDPLAARSAMTAWERTLGFKRVGGRAPTPEAWIPDQRAEAVPEAPGQYEARHELAERERGNIRDFRDIQFEDNERMRVHAAEQQQAAEKRAWDQEMKLGKIEEGVRRSEIDLDEQMQQHRTLIAKGLDPWRTFGSDSGKMAAVLGLMTTTFAGGEHAKEGKLMFNRMLDRAIDEQKYEMEVQGGQVDNAYGRLRDNYGDRDMAESALRILMQDAAATQLRAQMMETADPRAQAIAAEQINGIDANLLAENDRFRRLSIGKMTEHYQAYSPGSSGGMVEMTPDAHMKYLTSTSGLRKAEVGNRVALGKLDLAQEKATMTVDGETAPPGFKGRDRDLKGLQSLGASHRALSEIFKLMGADGRDEKTGLPIGEFDSDIAGKGIFGSQAAGMQAAMGGDDRGARLQTWLKIYSDARLRDASGAQVNESERKEFKKIADSTLEGLLAARLVTVSQSDANKRAALRSTLGQRELDFADRGVARQYAETYGAAPSGSLGSTDPNAIRSRPL